jgi:DeoR family ulaG and ulaABCDEF operon transcriptional repressor
VNAVNAPQGEGDLSDSDRRRQILEYLRDSPFASARDLAERLDVSVATVRRDIDKLDEQGLARKVYGGISAIDGAAAHGVFARTYTERSDLAVAAKNAIAAEAALMVQDGDAVIVHGGSTCFRLGERLAARNIRLCTNSMPLAAMLGEIGSCALTVVGGELHREPRILHGPTGGTPFFASKFFLSAQGVSERGLLESHPLLVDAISRFAECSDRIIALIDSSKFTTGARKLALPWSRIDTIITDDGLAAEHRAMLEAKGVEIRIAAVRSVEQ